tara:strand:+ start:38 stop:298 length:261 start_codon:yes stop_codon:yes gene_type:complete
MKSTLSKNRTAEDVKNNIGATIVQTMFEDPLMQRVGVIVGVAEWELKSKETYMYEIYWQPSYAMPMGRPYSSMHVIDQLGEHYFVT